jgi:hypothetical protein
MFRWILVGLMALAFAHGAIQWLAADAATTVYTVSGLSFQPKALRCYWNGEGSTVDAVAETGNMHRGVGFATSTSNRRAIGTFSQDTPTTSNCGSVAADDCVVGTTDGAAGRGAELDINSFTSDGFTLIVDDQIANDLTVFWEAWGGSDITVAVCGDIAEPATAVATDYTVTGFTSGATDQVVMLAGCQSTAAVNTAFSEASTLSVGFASGTADADNITVVGQSDDGVGTMDTDGACYTGECHGMITPGGDVVKDARAKLTAFGTNLFTLTWAERAITNRRSAFLAIKGGSWKAGSYTIAGDTLNATATVGSLAFAPIGLSLIGRMTAVQASDVTTAQDRIGLGTGSSTSSRRSMGVLDEDATLVAEVNYAIQYDQVLSFPSTTGTLQAAYDIDLMDATSFRIIVDVAGGVASEWQGYLTFGSAPVTAVPPPLLPRAQQYMRTGQ